METEPLYRVCVTWEGAVEDPADNEFDSYSEAVEKFDAEVERIQEDLKAYELLWGEKPTAEVSIYDTFECQNKDRWSSEDDR